MSGESFDMPNNLVAGKAMDNRAEIFVIDFLIDNIKDLNLQIKHILLEQFKKKLD